ncbi:MAG: hypothetical protein ACRC3J_08570 [Culicoidibacterales bacterium]
MARHLFTKGIEKLIDPLEVGTIHFLAPYNKLLPENIQHKIIEKSGTTTPYMGFVVEPYCYFLCYEIIDLEWAERIIPDNFKMVKSQIFEDDEPRYYGIFGCFSVHTSAFWGQRMEFYIIAENKETGLLTWIIADYDTNTISYDKKGGLFESNCDSAIITTDFAGNVIVDVKNLARKRQLTFSSNIENAKMQKLDQRLWIEGNLSIGYGREISHNSPDVFSLTFDPREVERALKVDLSDLELTVNSWYPGLLAEQPAQLACFPYAQHFLADSPGHSSKLMTKAELEQAFEQTDFSSIPAYSTKSMKKNFVIGAAIPWILLAISGILYLIK